ncbi:MAG: discoidin domain-containing protein [Acidobacteriaceae bacterium]
MTIPSCSRFPNAFALPAFLLCGCLTLAAQTIRIDAAAPVNTINPRTSVGAGIDRIPVAAIEHDFTSQALKPVLQAGWQPISYRQNTDLAIEAWHWNPVGTWSGPGDQGYFTGSGDSKGFISLSYGYALPHNGFTSNDGTGPGGFSRITDGNTSTYWKSDPYLTSRFTHESDALHPQWVVIDLSRYQLIDALKIDWAQPYATKYVVQYWSQPGLSPDPFHFPTLGVWATFPHGVIAHGQGGVVTLRLSQMPVRIRFLRIVMTASSNTCDTHGSGDPRDCVGYAINEVYLGTTSKDGLFHDLIQHTPDPDQTATYCSSVDSWHTAQSHVNKSQAQVGFDLFYHSGVTRGLPAMIPIAMLYDTPANAAAEIQYIENHKYPISYVEMGEEADGQYISPEDYGSLYLQFAAALHKVDPTLKLGGPSFQGVNQDIQYWPDAEGRTSWLGRFLLYLKEHRAMNELQFFSFEHYPYVPCQITWANLYEEPTLIQHIIDVWHADGLPPNVPYFITESNLSSSTGEPYESIFGGLWLADYIGSFLTDGGSGVYYFHDLPLQMERGCNNSAGTYGMFTVNPDYSVRQPLAQFFASQLINHAWLAPKGDNRIYHATSDIQDGVGNTLVTVYVARHPDGTWSVMLVNKDQNNSHRVQIEFVGADGVLRTFHGPIAESVFGRAQYHWNPPHRNFNSHLPIVLSRAPDLYYGGGVAYYGGGVADPDGPPVHGELQGGSRVVLPAASIVVLHGSLLSSSERTWTTR